MLFLDDLPLAFDRHDALAVGWTRHQFHRRVARDDIVEPAPRVFADAVAWQLADRESRHRALARIAQRRWSGAVVSHSSAAVLHGLPTPRHLPWQVSLTVNKQRVTSDDPGWVALQRSVLPLDLVEEVHGVAVTTLSRTAVDCLRTVPRADGLAVADAVVARGVPLAELVRVRQLQRRWPGVRTARWALGLVDGRRESWLESASAAVLDGWLPRAVPQVDVHDRATGRFLGRVDALWRDLRVVGEADGHGKFRGIGAVDRSAAGVADRLIATSERADRIREVGLGLVRWGTRDIGHPQALAARIRAAVPDRPLRAELSCARCRSELDDCTCAPQLCLPPSARDAA